MAYTKTNWSNLSPATPLNDANLNKIEAGIFNADATAEMALTTARIAFGDGTVAKSMAADASAAAGNALSVAQSASADATAALLDSAQAVSDVAVQAQYHTWRVVTVDTTASYIDNIWADTSDGNPLQIILPDMSAYVGPSAIVRVGDYRGTFGDSTCAVRQLEGQYIQGVNDSLYLITNNDVVELTWANVGWDGNGDADPGWKVTSKTN